MKHLCLNLKRFDVPACMGGVNRLADGSVWAKTIVEAVKEELEKYNGAARFPMYFPEAHVIPAAQAAVDSSVIEAGCQSVYRQDVAPGVNFGAYTTNRPAAAMKALGAKRIFICATFGLFTDGLEKFDEAWEKKIFHSIITTNLVYQKPELLSKPYYRSCDLSKFVALIIDSLNHDSSLSDLLDPVDRINRFLKRKGAK